MYNKKNGEAIDLCVFEIRISRAKTRTIERFFFASSSFDVLVWSLVVYVLQTCVHRANIEETLKRAIYFSLKKKRHLQYAAGFLLISFFVFCCLLHIFFALVFNFLCVMCIPWQTWLIHFLSSFSHSVSVRFVG